MSKLTIVFLYIFSFSSFARTIEGYINHIDYGRSDVEAINLYISDGSVLIVPGNTNKMNFYEDAHHERSTLRFTVDNERLIRSANLIKSFPEKVSKKSFKFFDPTILSSLEEAKNIFRNLRSGSSPRSQCYNRAQVWAYESKKKYGLNSMKVFMFYTRKYIRQYNFGWWFHVAPFTYVSENGHKTEKVLDYRFTREPTPMKPWTDIFMKNKVTCPEINRYSEYESNQEKEYCYLYKTSMYYVQPLDLDNLERNAREKTEFLNYEIKRAYRNGFDIWLEPN